MTLEPTTTRSMTRSVRLVVAAALGALGPLVLLAVLTTSRALEVVEQEVSARLRLTTALSGELLAEQLDGFVTLVEASARRPRLVAAVGDGNPTTFDDEEIEAQLATLAGSRPGLAGTGLFDLDGILLSSPGAPELIGQDFSDRDYYRGLTARGDTYASEAFQSAQSGNPFVLTVATYVRAPATSSETAGSPVAILIAGVLLDHVQSLVDDVADVQGVNLWVADQSGTVIATPSGRPSALVAVDDLPIGAALVIPSQELGEVDVDGVPMLVVRHEVEDIDWTVLAATPVATAQEGSNHIRRAVLGVGVPLAVVVIAGIVLLVRYQHMQWRAEALAHAARDEAREASRMKSEFLSRMSHELRTPMNSILGFGQLLELGEASETDKESVSHILKAGRHLLDLINEVLDIARIESGHLTLSMEPVSVVEVISETISLARPMAAQRSVALKIIERPSPAFVFADRQRLKQILLNMLSNAVKYNRAGGTVTVDYEKVDPDHVRVMVTDTGPGLEPERVEKLFVPFERLGAEQSEIEGTGIGLALSHGLAQAMGGKIGVNSTPGAGSTFWVELAVAEPPVEFMTGLVGKPTPHPTRSDRTIEHTVLYVEDNLANLNLVERIVARRGDIELIPCMQGSLGVELANEHQPGLILLDLHLPDISGETVLEQLHINPATASIPVVIISADATPGRVQRLLEAGAAAYLTKPIDVLELLRILDDLLV